MVTWLLYLLQALRVTRFVFQPKHVNRSWKASLVTLRLGLERIELQDFDLARAILLVAREELTVAAGVGSRLFQSDQEDVLATGMPRKSSQRHRWARGAARLRV